MRASPLLILLTMSAIWGLTWIAVKTGIEAVPPIFLAASRFVVAGTILLIIFRKEIDLRAWRDRWLKIVIVALFLGTLCYGGLFWGIQFTPSGIAAIINLSLIPVGLLVIGAIFRAEAFGLMKIVGVLVGIAGLTLMFAPEIARGGAAPVAGIAAITLATLAACLGSVLSKRWLGDLPTGAVSGAAHPRRRHRHGPRFADVAFPSSESRGSRSRRALQERVMKKSIAIIGAPSSAGAYAPGQEKAPAALRGAGLIRRLSERGFNVAEFGDVDGFRWRADRDNPRAMNIEHVARVSGDVAALVNKATRDERIALVLGGDCTVELGTISGLLGAERKVGLVYIDFDADLNTPETTTDGALDWMGVAHMLGAPGTKERLSKLGPRTPMLASDAVMLFGAGNIKPHERELIDRLGIATIPPGEIAADPVATARKAARWAKQFDALAAHFDVDVIDFEDFPIAEHTRRKQALTLDQTMRALAVLLAAPNLAALTLAEINPDHGAADGETMRIFAERLAGAFAGG